MEKEPPINDLELIRQTQEGDREAFSELVRRHHAKIIGLCMSVLGDVGAAEDAAQEAFLKAFKNIQSFRGEAQFGTWMYRIAYRVSIDFIRSRKRHRAESLEGLAEKAGDQIFVNPASLTNAPDVLGDKELVKRMLGELREEDRTLLLLREEQGLSYVELMKTLKCSMDAVKGRLKRARKDLKEKAQKYLSAQEIKLKEDLV